MKVEAVGALRQVGGLFSGAWRGVGHWFDLSPSPEKPETIFTRLESLDEELEEVSENVHGQIGQAAWKLIMGIPAVYLSLWDPLMDVGREYIILARAGSLLLGSWAVAEGVVNVSRAIRGDGYAGRLHEQIIALTGKIPVEPVVNELDKQIPFI